MKNPVYAPEERFNVACGRFGKVVVSVPLDHISHLHFYYFHKQPANIFISKDFKLKLIDYGNARKILAADGQLVDAVGVTEFTGE